MNLFPKNNQQTIQLIEWLYLNFGTKAYEERCIQLQHAQQCASLAEERGLGDECAVAAFLHDIGHLIADNLQMPEFNQYGIPHHDIVGAQYLQQWGFSERIVMMVKEHVQVKRYLAAVVPGFEQRLSHASKTTLRQQGGAMSASECEQYAKKPYLEDVVSLRNIDDCGKSPHKTCKPLSHWLQLMPRFMTCPLQCQTD